MTVPRRTRWLRPVSLSSPATTKPSTLSLHDALPICPPLCSPWTRKYTCRGRLAGDRKSTRLNSSHQIISYAVFCLKKKKQAKGVSVGAVHAADVAVVVFLPP